jgi:prepilin-type N-terminal cleavage/methylation domain-containing protein
VKKYINNERGLTLIELLAVLVIGSLILILISNIHIFGHKQNKEQSQKAASLYDVSYAAKVITKEIRKAEKVKVKNDILTLNPDKPNQVIFKESNGSIFMNESPIVMDITRFIVKRKEGSNKIIELDIESQSLNGKITTEIYFRGGDLIE